MSTHVRDAVFDNLRRRGMMTIFANPGSTEVAFLAGMPDDFEFVLGLHESSVVGMAAGYAIGSGRPAFVLLHTTAGLGNAVGAIATARVNRAPLVIVVGQQDRRHLALDPFLAGRLEGLAGDYPLDVLSPMRGADVPSAIERAGFVAEQGRGPVLVIVPMDDWEAEVEPHATAAPGAAHAAPRGIPAQLAAAADLLRVARSVAIVAGSGNDTEDGWRALTTLAEHLDAPVWIEPFGARAGFPQDHRLYQGQVPADRPRVRDTFTGHDAVLVVGTHALRQYPFRDGPLFPDGTRIVLLTDDPDQANRSAADLALIGDVPGMLDALTAALPAATTQRDAAPPAGAGFALDPPAAGQPMRAAHVFGLLADSLPADTIVVEESPSSRPALQAMVPARAPLGFVSAAMGGLGFAMPAAIGLKKALPDRPVLAVVGDGSAMYSIQSLWSAGDQAVGVVFLVMANGTYAVMDRLAEQRDGKSAWPQFPAISTSQIARGYGIEARRVDDYAALVAAIDDVTTGLAQRREPLLLEIRVQPDSTFAP
jgi:benzoylformate decarboxylase